jgi:hypothetical protein
MAFIYNTVTPPVHHLAGTPHVRGAKEAVGEVRASLRRLAAVLVKTGWSAEHPIPNDTVGLDVIELVNQLGSAERHALRITTALLVRITKANGYHEN